MCRRFFSIIPRPPRSPLFPYTTLFRSQIPLAALDAITLRAAVVVPPTRVFAAKFEIAMSRSEEHTSELQSRPHLVCRLLLEKKKGRCAGTDRARRAVYGRAGDPGRDGS